jgi:hypothetical protein
MTRSRRGTVQDLWHRTIRDEHGNTDTVCSYTERDTPASRRGCLFYPAAYCCCTDTLAAQGKCTSGRNWPTRRSTARTRTGAAGSGRAGFRSRA